jgi:hypothetical protein
MPAEVTNRAGETLALGKTGRTGEKYRLSSMKRAVRELGDHSLDGRTSVAKALAEWKAELIDDLGGRQAISTQQTAIIDLAVKTKLLLDSVDAWLLTRPSIIDKRRRTLLRIVRERQQLADALSRYLQVLGLARRSKPIDLHSYVATRYAAEQRAQEASDPRNDSNPDDDSGDANRAMAEEEDVANELQGNPCSQPSGQSQT